MNAARNTAYAVALGFLAAACGHDSGTGINNQANAGTFGGFAGGVAGPGVAGSLAGGTVPAGAAGGAAPGTAGNGTGGAAPGAAGVGAAGGAAPGTAGGAAPAAGSGATQSGGGYLVVGSWKGYAWTTANPTDMTTIMPKDFTGLAAGAPLCVMGSVAVTTDYSGFAMLGWNINQEATTGAPQMAATPTGSGLMVNVTNTGGSALRVQIQAADGDTNEEHRWCAPVSGTGGLMPWTAFNTKCWDNSGAAYAKEPLTTVAFMVPGNTTMAVPYNFCVNSVGESADATGSAPAAGSGAPAAGSGAPAAGSGAPAAGSGAAGTMASNGGPGTGSGTLSGQYDWHAVMRDGRNYIVQNNVWGGGASQTLNYNGTSFEITQRSGNNPTTGQPGSYPSVFIGSNNGHTTSGSNLPKQVSALQSVQTSWTHNGGSSIAGQYNAAYDVWFSTNAGGDSGAPSGGYLMVWLYKANGVQPLGNTITQSGATIAGVEGTWDVWIGQQMGRPCISYVRSQALGSISFDLNKFIQDAAKRPEKPIQSSWYLTNVFAGFEIWNGGNGLKTSEFSAIVQ